jgi:8-oxo-dGTP diphosphatase
MRWRSTVRAAGGAVWRRSPADPAVREVALVHRPKYDDWSLPKGKRERGETDEQTARREVREETGLTCRLGAELPSVRYVDNRGRPKTVRYWAMTVDSQTERPPDDEVDEWCWLPEAEALARLSYPYDQEVVIALRTVAEPL